MAEAIRVLYVDDETGLLEIAKIFLEEAGDCPPQSLINHRPFIML